jgi:hypothetical protein
MRAFLEDFEWLYFTEAHFGAPRIVGQTITIPVKNLPLFPPHPLVKDGNDRAIKQHPALGGVVDGLLVFRGVSSSKRKIYKARDIPPDLIVDVDTPMSNESQRIYSFEGRLNERITIASSEWQLQDDVGVDWDILAHSFELQVE